MLWVCSQIHLFILSDGYTQSILVKKKNGCHYSVNNFVAKNSSFLKTIRLKCTFGPPILIFMKFWSPYFKTQLFGPPF
jgi:hypothetical protein